MNDDQQARKLKIVRLQKRQAIMTTVRADLYGEDFLEVETPLLLKSSSPDPHIDPIEVGEGYLVTSTEYQIKRLLVTGLKRLFTLTKNFRAHDRGRYHSVEFTMLEWARVGESLHQIEEDAVRFIRKAFRALYPEKSHLTWQGATIDLMGEGWERLTVRSAFATYLGLEELEDFSWEPLMRAIKKASIELPFDPRGDGDLLLSYLFDLLQSHLGFKRPTFLQEWPASLTSSAPRSTLDPHAVERSELYIAGIEIADGFPFLRDPKLQRELFLRDLQRRQEAGKPAIKIDERYLQALEDGLPEGAGMALGIDRLVMILTGSSSLSEVQSFDWDEI